MYVLVNVHSLTLNCKLIINCSKSFIIHDSYSGQTSVEVTSKGQGNGLICRQFSLCGCGCALLLCLCPSGRTELSKERHHSSESITHCHQLSCRAMWTPEELCRSLARCLCQRVQVRLPAFAILNSFPNTVVEIFC